LRFCKGFSTPGDVNLRRKISQLKRLHLDGTCRGLLQTSDDYVNKRREHGTPENTIEIAMHGKDILLSARR
jgi:hypothetical protein